MSLVSRAASGGVFEIANLHDRGHLSQALSEISQFKSASSSSEADSSPSGEREMEFSVADHLQPRTQSAVDCTGTGM